MQDVSRFKILDFTSEPNRIFVLSSLYEKYSFDISIMLVHIRAMR